MLIDHKGFTLIELITTIVVVGIASTALLGVFSGMVQGSADPAVQQQAVTIAEAYLEEIQLKAFEDPQGGETNGREEGTGIATDRALFDDVQDYNDLSDNLVRDQFGNNVAALSRYRVTVTANFTVLDTITLASQQALLITVNVTHDAIDGITLHGYRTSYP